MILMGLGNFSCGEMSAEEKELDALYRTVMSIHDDVMPEMSTIRKLGKQVKKHNDAATTSYKSISKKLDDEGEGMMNWMHEFKKPDYKQYDVSKKYLLQEKEKIERVREGMLTAIEEAKILINQN